MRPVDKGPAPQQFTNYQDACAPLEQRLGRYCSFCERLLETHLAVEHVMPKSRHKDLALEWDNFLLACVNCNSSKGSKPVLRPPHAKHTHLWPDEHNTLLAFKYIGGWVEVGLARDHPAFSLAEETVQLLGLDKYEGNPDPNRQPTEADRRWSTREIVRSVAERSRQNLRNADSPFMRDQIIQTALARGGFSIWFATFADDADMQQRLLDAFPSSAKNCFDGVKLIPRDPLLL
ncbi:HNH endonuclease [Massilia sp. W12]|uniref:HNH endonuclease n=1 Tax=Massilia sp. W12 TaxID=3126507 RepID=UPI0030D53B3E